MTENTTETIEFDAEVMDLFGTEAEDRPEIEYQSVLRAWLEILKPENIEAGKGITLAWSNQICSQFPEMTYAKMPAFHDAYFELLETMAGLVAEEVAGDEDYNVVTSKEEDVERNRLHFLNLLRRWQLVLITREVLWECTSPTAAEEVAALGAVNQFYFGQRGLTGHLEAIALELTDDEQQELSQAIEARKDELLGGTTEEEK